MPGSLALVLSDPYEFQRSVRASEVKVIVAAPGEYRADLTRIDLNHLWMQRGSQSLPSIAHVALHASRSSIFFLADAEQSPMVHGGLELAPGAIVFPSSGSDSHLQFPPNSRWAAMSLSPDDLAEFGWVMGGCEVTAPAVTRVMRPPPAAMSRLLALHKAAGALAATVPDIFAHAAVAKAIEQELVRAMIACLADQGAAESSQSSRQRATVMRRFEQMLEEHADQPLYIAEICAAIGVTDRTLRLHCADHLGMSPHRYLWLRRMNLARRALRLAEGSGRTVTEIANDHGFGELGRFAVSYRRLFGESPSATLRRPPDDSRFRGVI